MHRIKKLGQQIIPFCILILFSLYYASQLFFNHLLIYGEEQGLLNYDYANFRYKTLWEGTNNFGTITLNIFNLFTTGTIWRLARLLGLSLWQSEFFFYASIIFLTVAFSYSAFLYISKNRFISLLLSVLYITSYNYYATVTTTPKLLHALIVPISVFFWHKFNDTQKKRYLIFDSLFLLFLLGIAINIPQMIGAYCFIFIYILIFSFPKLPLRNALFFLAPYVLNVLFVFVVSLIVIHNSGNFVAFDQFKLQWSAVNSAMYDILRFFGGWWDYAGSDNLFYNNLVGYYHQYFGIIMTYIPFFMLFSFIFFKKKQKRDRLKILLLVFIMLTLVKGGSPPFSFVFNTFFRVSFFKIFREPWAKFITNFIFATYLGIALLWSTSSRRSQLIGGFVLISLLVFQCLPIVTGTVIDHRNIGWKISDVAVPDYWQQLQHYSEKNLTDKRILVLPINLHNSEPITNMWSPIHFLGKPEEFFLYSNKVGGQYLTPEDTFITSNYLDKLDAKRLSLASFDYVLNKRDAIAPHQKLVTLNQIQGAVNRNKKISFGQLDLYPITQEFKTNKIRTVSSIYETDKGCAYNYVANSENANTSAYINVIKAPHDKIHISTDRVATNYIKINDSLYEIRFESVAKKDIGLLFVELFNHGWKLYPDKGLFTKPILSEQDHFSANCFANFWIIPHDVVNSHLHLYLQYAPQLLFEKIVLLFIILFALFFIIVVCALKKIPPVVINCAFPKINTEKIGNYPIIKAFVKYRLFALCVGLIIIKQDPYLFTETIDLHIVWLILLWLLVVMLFSLPSKINLKISAVFFILLIVNRLNSEIYTAERMAVWFYLFILFYLVTELYQQIFLIKTSGIKQFYISIIDDGNELLHYIANTNGIIVRLMQPITTLVYHGFKKIIKGLPKTPEEHVRFKINITILLIIISIVYAINGQVQYYIAGQLVRPKVIRVEPLIVYPSTKIIVFGHNFGWNDPKKKIRLVTQYGEVNATFWSDQKIIFTVPLHWKAGTIHLWVEKLVLWDRKYIWVRSDIQGIKLIPITSVFTKDDDLYFDQLKQLSPETLQLNGYSNDEKH